MRSHILNRHQLAFSRDAERFILPSPPLARGNGQRAARWFGVEWIRRKNTAGLSFPPVPRFTLFSAYSYVAGRKQRTEYENEVDPEGETRRGRDVGDRGRGRDGPRGALGFHYAKPQMESCDRVSLRGRPRRRTMAPGIRLLRCNVT